MLVKVLNDNMLHFGFQYNFGLNILDGQLNTNPKIPVGEGGLYYCEIEELDSHIYRGDMLCVVEIPEDAITIQLQLYGNKYFRTDKLILTSEIYRFDNNDDVKKLINLNPNIKNYLNDPCFIRLNRTIV
jgi:hypothetical protein